jgi:transitional endoplasmic reticulum ATPase
LKIYSEELKLTLEEKQILKISRETNGFVGADLLSLIRQASLYAFNRFKSQNKKDQSSEQQITQDFKIENCDLNEALFQIRPSGIKDLLVEIPQVSQ